MIWKEKNLWDYKIPKNNLQIEYYDTIIRITTHHIFSIMILFGELSFPINSKLAERNYAHCIQDVHFFVKN